jgi:hypothetical protein
MDRINIDNLFPSSNKHGKKPLDVYSLYHPNEVQKVDENIFSIESLIDVREDKKRRGDVHYEKIYSSCLNRIANANKMNLTDIIYRIPEAIYRCPEYNAEKCLKILETRLRTLYLDTLIVNKNTIFISWLNLASNRKNAEVEKKKK